MPFWTYILHCNAGLFYTGHTDHLEHRIADHKAGRFPGFTKRSLPVELAWSQEFTTRDEAKAAEKQIKGWSRKKKLALIRGDWDEISRLANSKSSPSTSSGQTGLLVAQGAINIMLAAAVQAAPEEACGLLLGAEGRIDVAYSARNVALDPQRHFEIDPQTLIDAHRSERGGGPELVGYFHSHPSGPPEPSLTDREQAAGDGRVWAIVASGLVSFWCDTAAGFEPLDYEIFAA